ncbi:MAG: hypothetical protein JW888_15460 [Pirellulales bacterium]|nr:hypothetical protein [Pirellulales bacterium]
MHFRQSGQRDPRRRRVLADLVLGRLPGADRTADTWGRSSVEPRSKNYGEARFLDEQLRLTDLIPRRIGVFVLLFLVGTLVVAGLLTLHVWTARFGPMTTDGAVAAFDLDGEGTLAVWFSSTVLLLASLTAVVVYTIRRYKKNDYQGYYRVWLWAALCWGLLSLDETASLHEGFTGMMTYLTGTRLYGDGSAWWMIAYFFLLGGVGTRLALDMRECRRSFVAFLCVAACYGLAVIAQLGWIWETETARAIMLEEGAEMMGNLFLLLAMGLHARHVILDAEGLLPQNETDDEEEDVADEEYEEEEEEEDYDREELAAEEAALFGHPVRVHPPHGSRRPLGNRVKRAKPAAKKEVDAFSAGMQAAEDRVGRRLTKQEKKALRRRLEKMRRERERRSA